MTHYFLLTPRLGFRSWSDADIELAVSLWGDPEVTALFDSRGRLARDQVKERLSREIENERALGVQYWPFFLRASGDFVGCAGLKPYDPARGLYELGFHLRRACWGQGYATEAGRAVIEHAFGALKPAALLAGHNPRNHASKRVLEKLGFTYLRDEHFAGTGLMHPLYELRPPRAPATPGGPGA
jgi:RimJ/RimL family protein N-acetyltransferase